MAIQDLTYYRQIEDYVDALRAYLGAATGLPVERIVFSPPDIAKRKLKERVALQAGYPTDGKTRELDNFLSFHFPFTTPNIAYNRQSPMTVFFGSVAAASGYRGFQDQYDLPVQIDVWGGPDQNGKAFVFENKTKLQFWLERHQRIQVAFRDLVTKNPAHPFDPYDVSCWYEILRWTANDNSRIENLFTEGSIYRITFEFNWMISLYRFLLSGTHPDTEQVQSIKNIVLMILNDETKVYDQEWDTNSYTTTTTSTTTTTTTSGL